MRSEKKYEALIRLTKMFPSLVWVSLMRFKVQAVLQEEMRNDLEILEENHLITDLLVDGEREPSSSQFFLSVLV